MNNKYVIRFKDGQSSEPLSLEDLKEKIKSGRVRAETLISIFPNEFSVEAKSYAEFEELFHDDEGTLVYEKNKPSDRVHEEKTKLFEEPSKSLEVDLSQVGREHSLEPVEGRINPRIQKHETQVIQRPEGLLEKPKKEKSKLPKRSFLVMMLLCLILYEVLYEDSEKAPPPIQMTVVRPRLPAAGLEAIDPQKSTQIYQEGIKPYLEDTVQGYRRAVDIFHLALRYDPENVKALAMLASSYLNLLDSSNKDENTFSVINKLIELSKVKKLDLVETVIAEVEFLAVSRRHDAAIQRLTDYSKVLGKFDPVLFYYLSWVHSLKGEYSNAMKYLNLISASALPIPKLYYLRGYLHEQNNELDQATAEYKRALHINPKHARSILGLVRVSEKKGELKKVLRLVEFLTGNPSYQNPKEYVSALIYRSKLALLFNEEEEALSSLQRAIRIEPNNEELKLEYYTLLSRSGDNPEYQQLAQMFSLVLESERHYREGKIHEAISVLIQAQDSFSKSSIPLEKMGDLFYSESDYRKAQRSYKKAIEVNPKSGTVAIKLIDSLIRNHDWQDAQNYLARYRSHPALKSSIDRLAGDLAFHQGAYQQAIGFYKKAMARDSIDEEVYASYATALRKLDQCRDAQFFYSLAQRFDPFNYQAIIGSAQCLLKTDGINTAVSRIQEELSKLPQARADLLAGIAEIYLLANQEDKALNFAEQAKEIDSEYPESYRIEGEAYLRQMLTKKEAEKNALQSLKAYSDRKPSDPTGYIKRFEIFMKKSQFQEAMEELNRVFEVSPQYPELHYRRAQLYSSLGRWKEALEELDEELKANPRFAKGWIDQGDIFLRMNRLDDAMKSFSMGMQVDPMNPQAKIGAGAVNYHRKQYGAAIALFQAALNLDKGNPIAYKNLGMAYRASGDHASAAKAFRSYLDLAPDAPDRAQFEQYR